MTVDLFVVRDSCPVCGEARADKLFGASFGDETVRSHVASHFSNQGTVDYDLLDGADLTILKCLNCHLIYQRLAPTGRLLHALYNEFIDPVRLKQREMQRLTYDNFFDVGRRLADLFRLVRKKPTDIHMLDYGFGYGRWARVAVGMGARVSATEITPEKIAFARSIGVEVLRDSDLPSRQFDVVHAEQVFEHLADPAGTFDTLASCLVPGGVFKIAVPKQGHIESLLKRHGLIDYSPYARDFKGGKRDYHTVTPLEHVNSFCLRSIQALANRADLTVRTAGFGARHADLDIGSPSDFVASSKQWGVRIAKDLYNLIGPGRGDSSCYLLFHR